MSIVRRIAMGIAAMLVWGALCVPHGSLAASANDSSRRVVVNTARSDIHGVVHTIKFFGNRRTEETTIRREMTVHEGDSVTGADLQESQERIYNIALFNTVDVVGTTDSASGHIDILVIVSERWYIWPKFIVGVKDRDWAHIFSKGSKVYAGLGAVHFNVRGRREKIFVGAVLGYDPWARLEYGYLSLDSAQNSFLDGALAASRTLNLSDTAFTHGTGFNEIRYEVSAFAYRRVSRRTTIGIRAGLQTLHLTNSAARLTLDPSGNDLMPFLGIEAGYDSRDDAEYALNGALIYAFARKYGAGTYINYERFYLDGRAYHSVGPITVAMRAMTNMVAGGNVPVYDHVYLGLSDRIRGEYNVKREGENAALGSVELRFPFIRHGRVLWDAPSWVPSQFTAAQFTIALAVFADAGTTWFRGESLSQQCVSNGVGAGLHIVFPYGSVLRLEYAVHGTHPVGQFIFDLSTAF
jgi:outer membrane protein assembly factor BamA